MKTEKRKIGDKGEDLSEKFLVKQGYEIIQRNYWKPWGEIDIIGRKDGVVHFFEVKTVVRDIEKLRSDDEYTPYDNVTFRKKHRMSRAIKTFLLENRKISNCDWQADVMAVYLDKNSDDCKIEMLEDIELF